MDSKYCKPLCAGLLSQPRQVGTRIAHLLDALDKVNSNLIDGQLAIDCMNTKHFIIAKLKKEGWRISITNDDKWKVLPPKN